MKWFLTVCLIVACGTFNTDMLKKDIANNTWIYPAMEEQAAHDLFLVVQCYGDWLISAPINDADYKTTSSTYREYSDTLEMLLSHIIDSE